MAERAAKSLNGNADSSLVRDNGFTTTRSPSIRIPPGGNGGTSHRLSFSSEQFTAMPQSPRNARHASRPSIYVQELLKNPPKAGVADPRFVGRDWQTITTEELCDSKDIFWAEVDTNIEDAANKMIENDVQVLLVRVNREDKSAVATFDYNDLNQYLLFATQALRPSADHMEFYKDLAARAHTGAPIPLRDAKSLGSKEPFIMIPHTARLAKAIEAFGSGVHRLIIVKEWTNEVIGILSQFKLVKFLWENGQAFSVINQLYSHTLKDLNLGSRRVISINGDRPLREALLLMEMDGIGSLAVVDAQHNVIGNISTVDVKLLTSSSSAPLLDNTCTHFISVILSTRGMQDGKDSVPVFYISPYSTLAHTVAKMVATRSHRLWMVEAPSPSSTAPQTPVLGPASLAHPGPASSAQISSTSQPMPPLQHSSNSVSVPSTALPGQHMSGKLSGVVSLTDILNLFARATGLHPTDPVEIRRSRRRSSSASSLHSVNSGVTGSAIRQSLDEQRGAGSNGGI